MADEVRPSKEIVLEFLIDKLTNLGAKTYPAAFEQLVKAHPEIDDAAKLEEDELLRKQREYIDKIMDPAHIRKSEADYFTHASREPFGIELGLELCSYHFDMRLFHRMNDRFVENCERGIMNPSQPELEQLFEDAVVNVLDKKFEYTHSRGRKTLDEIRKNARWMMPKGYPLAQEFMGATAKAEMDFYWGIYKQRPLLTRIKGRLTVMLQEYRDS